MTTNTATVDTTWTEADAKAWQQRCQEQAEVEARRDAWMAERSRRNQELIAASKLAKTSVRCDCGHTVSQNLVMNTSRGTACPDCYDRMSD
jgi:hypothetical protein